MTPADILAARKRLGMTQAQFAEALRLGKDGGRYIRRLEAGQQEPSGPLTLAIELLVQTRLAEAEGLDLSTKGQGS